MFHIPFVEPKSNTVVLLKKVCKTYTGDIPVLQNFSMSVEEGHV